MNTDWIRKSDFLNCRHDWNEIDFTALIPDRIIDGRTVTEQRVYRQCKRCGALNRLTRRKFPKHFNPTDMPENTIYVPIQG